MSYLFGGALQQAVFTVLDSSVEIAELTNGLVFDAPPVGEVPDTYVLIGEERILDRSSKTSTAAVHDLKISVLSGAQGFLRAKEIAGAICKELTERSVALSVGVLCDLQFRSARAARASGQDQRQIVLNFRAYIDAS